MGTLVKGPVRLLANGSAEPLEHRSVLAGDVAAAGRRAQIRILDVHLGKATGMRFHGVTDRYG